MKTKTNNNRDVKELESEYSQKLTDFQTHSDSAFIWKAQVHNSSQSVPLAIQCAFVYFCMAIYVRSYRLNTESDQNFLAQFVV